MLSLARLCMRLVESHSYLCLSSLKKMTVGMFLASMAFVVAAIVQVEIDVSCPLVPQWLFLRVRWNVRKASFSGAVGIRGGQGLCRQTVLEPETMWMCCRGKMVLFRQCALQVLVTVKGAACSRVRWVCFT